MAKKKKGNRSTKKIKEILFEKYGTYCWLCQKYFDKKHLTGHHVIPFRECRCTEINNIFLVCECCHFSVINHITYPSKEYDDTMNKMRTFRDSKDRG